MIDLIFLVLILLYIVICISRSSDIVGAGQELKRESELLYNALPLTVLSIDDSSW